MSLLALLLTLLPSCVSSGDTRPALTSAALCREVFLTNVDGNEQLIRRSNPPPDTLRAYLEAQQTQRTAYDRAHNLLLSAIGSMSATSPEQLNATMNQILELIIAAKGKLTPP